MKRFPVLFAALLSCLALQPAIAAKKVVWDYPYVQAVPDGPVVQLLQDQAFTNGFRAFWSCRTFSSSSAGLGYIGECTNYFTPFANTLGKQYSVHTWPDTGAPNDVGKYWNFNEGIHAGFLLYDTYTFPLELPPNPQGTPDPRNYPTLYPSQYRLVGETEFGGHRLEANQESTSGIVSGLIWADANQIWLQSMNNLSPLDPNWNGLVRTVVSNRAGEIMTYMNTKNEMRNVATQNISTFAYDTWPHFHLEQNFKKVIDLANLRSLILNFNVELPLAQFLPGWITPSAPAYTCGSNEPWQSIDFNAGFMLRRKDNPAAVVFMGYPLYSCHAPNLAGRFFVDQFGSAAYSGNVADIGGVVQPAQSGPGVHNPANYRQISFDLRTLMNKALTHAASISFPPGSPQEVGRQAFLLTTLDDYYLASFGIGWETLGYQHVQSYVSGVSLYGIPKAIFDSEVYQESTSAYQQSTYKAYNDPTGPYTEGQMRAHWARFGCHEGRVASTTFDVRIYMDRWGAVGDPTTGHSTSTYNYMPQCYDGGVRDYECAIDHYVWSGRRAGHPGHW